MKQIPFLLIYSRILIAIVIICVVVTKPANTEAIIAVLMVIGLLTDVFDGIIARKLNVSSQSLRIWDSNTDQFFWVSVTASIFYLKFNVIKPLLIAIIILISLEILTYIISYFKFKKTIATHSLLSKLWTITLLAFLLEVLLYSTSDSFIICLYLGVISRLEIIAIIIKLKKWTTDVPTIFAVKDINEGKVIKKNKWFNG